MRYSPLETELGMLSGMSVDERLHYATTRMVESEEVWSLGDENGWIVRDQNKRQVISIWPYRQLALEHAGGGSEAPIPQATSLEYFVYGVLEMCRDGDIWLDVFPHGEQPGKLMSSADLFEILNGMLETNEYFIEG
jgi:hypothetical protein